MLAAALCGHVRRVVLDTAGVVIDLGAAPGCSPVGPAMRCCWVIDGVSGPDATFAPGAAKPTTPHPGPTTDRHAPTTAAPACARHNRWKQRGYRTCARRQTDTGTPTDPTAPKSPASPTHPTPTQRDAALRYPWSW